MLDITFHKKQKSLIFPALCSLSITCRISVCGKKTKTFRKFFFFLYFILHTQTFDRKVHISNVMYLCMCMYRVILKNQEKITKVIDFNQKTVIKRRMKQMTSTFGLITLCQSEVMCTIHVLIFTCVCMCIYTVCGREKLDCQISIFYPSICHVYEFIKDIHVHTHDNIKVGKFYVLLIV